MSRTSKITISICLLIIAGLIISFSVQTILPNSPIKIGVLLPITGPDSVDSKELLEWMKIRFNHLGGVRGQPVELIYKDTAKADILNLAHEFADDPSIQIVIGPQKSSELHAIAPIFIESRKLLISPMATAGDIFRAYEKKDYIWRTCQSDIAQVRAILYELSTRKVTRISLIHTKDSYGSTFLEWTGFFCTELGIDLLNTVGYSDSSNLEVILAKALSGDPEYIVMASSAKESAEFVKLLNARSARSKVIFTDATETNHIIEALGTASQGIELMSPAADPDSGFEEAYFADYGYYPYDTAASTCDAFLLAAYTLARQETQKGMTSFLHRESIEDSFKKIINGAGSKIKWNEPDRAVALILKGELPDFEGASGPLKFDKEFGVDPVESFYSLNRIENRDGVIDFYTIRRFSSLESKGIGILEEGASAASTRASLKFLKLNKNTKTSSPAAERKGLRAVIISSSGGWSNYRHQADALAVYQLLRKNGVSDNDIVFFSVDDVPWMAQNVRKGDMHHEIQGANLRENVMIDYSGAQVTPENIRKVLLGRQSLSTPVVLESNENTNVLIYLVGHGMPRAINFMNGDQLKAGTLARLLDEMYDLKRFRQMLVLVEACYGESMALELDTPGVLFLTGSSRIESSFGANYDPKIRQWLSDEFTVQAIQAMAKPGIKLEELYLDTYTHVSGSHVTLANYQQFGDLQTKLSEFTKP